MYTFETYVLEILKAENPDEVVTINKLIEIITGACEMRDAHEEHLNNTLNIPDL